MKTKFNIRVHGYDFTDDVMVVDALIVEVKNIKFAIHREVLSKDNLSDSLWTVSEYYTGMAMWHNCHTQKECKAKIYNWFDYDDMTSRLESFHNARDYAIKKYGQLNGEVR